LLGVLGELEPNKRVAMKIRTATITTAPASSRSVEPIERGGRRSASSPSAWPRRTGSVRPIPGAARLGARIVAAWSAGPAGGGGG
jgi:hypothetical protein